MDSETERRVHALWDTLARSGATEIEGALEYLLAELLAMAGGRDALWIAGVRMADAGGSDPINGWRPRFTRHLHEGNATVQERLKMHVSRLDSGNVDPSFIANLREAGQFRVTIKNELVPPGWFESEFYRTLFAPYGIGDAIYVASPLSEDVEFWIGIQRGVGEPFFGEAERELLSYAVRPLLWFLRRVMLHNGLVVSERPLTGAERRVLGQLLSDKTEPQIAEELNLSYSTVHTYCQRICKKFNVRGRPGLAALWLGQEPDRFGR